MGMDVYGLNPKTKTGEYFRNNVWYWSPLWDYCSYILPDIANKVEYAYSNDGDGLNSVDSRKLGFALRKSIESGAAQQYIDERQTYLDALPQEPCFCTTLSLAESYDSTGYIPFPKLNSKTPNHQCHICKGTGLSPSFELSYFIDIDNIFSFSRFLMDCGGFQIC